MIKTRELLQPLRGIIPPMVTPLLGPDELDETGLARLVEHLVGGGVHGLFVLGTCGEGMSLSQRLRRELVDRVCTHVDRRIPVLVSITDTALVESLALARHADDAGADAVVLAAPCFLPLDQAALLSYVERVVREVALPLVLYNMPAITKVNFEPETVRRLMDVEAVVGLKDSSGDLDYFQTIRELSRKRPDWSLLVGPEHLLVPCIEMGGDGGVSGGANVWPQLFVQMYEAAIANLESAIPEQQDLVSHLVDKADRLGQIYQYPHGDVTPASVIKGLKSALAMLGICDDYVAPPLEQCTAMEREKVACVIRELGVAAASIAD